ncbi:hypothetical protein MTX26_26590 [Bradyrhizobium sp. ISRA443]|uniref:hypothetical protein n=1 Tax=unclassified Bradyrhizobium TaxID=2631580 RepID=UPI0024797242|nr:MULTISPECIES: hypothetical protein [unclassified Bradyrhizobium]WGR93371.1 hypothetical protein MTX20_37640 [Bradyrhizobium sp. ISRA435]WGR97905.1 hypothetical protein MTX23_26580 [Bradyrhizobium sp. ISRA436]WGS04795.1 hypothetical protein MTX18_26590 [Bradyrhizobium sp. ISRA437]WGS11676.1 hypothetical protein MTX26_26590 [Bradyrhizobium sp. ISRA443]
MKLAAFTANSTDAGRRDRADFQAQNGRKSVLSFGADCGRQCHKCSRIIAEENIASIGSQYCGARGLRNSKVQ